MENKRQQRKSPSILMKHINGEKNDYWINYLGPLILKKQSKDSFTSPYHKINSRWIKWLKVKTEAPQKLEYK